MKLINTIIVILVFAAMIVLILATFEKDPQESLKIASVSFVFFGFALLLLITKRKLFKK